MKDTEYDVFDQLLEDALASDAVPSDDFTVRLMEQVRRTPQERPRHMRPALKALAALAACAVIAAAIPLAMPRMGSAADSSAAAADTADVMDGAVKQYAADDAENNMMVCSSARAGYADDKRRSRRRQKRKKRRHARNRHADGRGCSKGTVRAGGYVASAV